MKTKGSPAVEAVSSKRHQVQARLLLRGPITYFREVLMNTGGLIGQRRVIPTSSWHSCPGDIFTLLARTRKVRSCWWDCSPNGGARGLLLILS